jgi:hypothetical protein
MKTRKRTKRLRLLIVVWAALVIGMPAGSRARPRSPLPPIPEFAPLLFRESFDFAYSYRTTNAVVSVPNYGELIESWSGYALQRAGARVTPFIVPAVDSTGRTNFSATGGVLRWWLRPYWSSGSGPGVDGRLIEVVAAGGREFLSLRVAPDGSVVYLVGQSDAGHGLLLKAPLAWETGQWHLVALDYGPKGTALFLDGELAAEGAGTLAAPPSVAQVVVGSTWAGTDTPGCEFDELAFFGRSRFRSPPTDFIVKSYFAFASGQAALGAISPEEDQAQRDALARRQAEREAAASPQDLAGASPEGGGGGAPAGANFGPNDLWLEIFYGTNSAPITLHNTTNGVRYQLLSRPEVAQPPWLVEQTLFGAAGTNTTTTVPFNERPILFFWAGVDSDGDGLIDYLETLNGTDPKNPDSDFDGVNDYVEFIQGRNPNDPNGAVPDTTGLVNLKVYTPLR